MYLPRPPSVGWAGGQGLDYSIPPGSPAILRTESTPGSEDHQRCMGGGSGVIESTNLPTFSLPGPGGIEPGSGWHQDGRALPLLRPLCILGFCLTGFSRPLDKH